MALSDSQSTALDQALLERKELLETIKVATAKLEKIEQFLAMYRQFATGNILDVEKESQVRLAAGTSPHHAQKQFESQVRALLLDTGRPMENPEIIEKLKARGMTIASRSLQKHVYNKLWKAKKNGVLDHFPGMGYWLKDEPLSEESAKAAEEARLERFRKQNEVERRPWGQAKGRPWKGQQQFRPRQLTDEQLATAEEWLLAGKMTRTEMAKELGGINVGTLAYYFKGGVQGILARRGMPPELLTKKDAAREALRLRLLLAKRTEAKRGQTSLLSNLDYDAARERLAAIESRFPELAADNERR